jgi:hypothetical protein
MYMIDETTNTWQSKVAFWWSCNKANSLDLNNKVKEMSSRIPHPRAEMEMEDSLWCEALIHPIYTAGHTSAFRV